MIALEVESIILDACGEVAGIAMSLTKAMQLAELPGLSAAILDFYLGQEDSLPVAAKLYAAGIPFLFHTAAGVRAVKDVWPNVPVLRKLASPDLLIGALGSLANSPRTMRAKLQGAPKIVAPSFTPPVPCVSAATALTDNLPNEGVR